MSTHSDLMYGTAWKEADTQRCVRDALTAGFRAIDTANQRKHYFEEGVGNAIHEAINNAVVTRDELFLQTKFTFLAGQDQRLPYDPDADVEVQVHQSFESSLKHLRTEYLDSLLLHGPSRRVGLGDDDLAVWDAMEQLAESGKVKELGVSNVGIDQLQALCEAARIKPRYVQNRCFATVGWDRAIRQFCRDQDIVYQGFSLLTANSHIFRHPTFRRLVKRYDLTPAQFVFRFAAQVGIWPLTGTTDRGHMQEDLAAFQGESISADDVQEFETAFIV